MRHLVATLRRRPGPLAGTFVALFVAAVVVTMTATLARTGQTLKPPVQRLAGATAVLTGNPKVKVVEGQDANTLAITGYRRLPVSIASSLSAVKGVSQAIPDLSIPLALQQPGRPADDRKLSQSAQWPRMVQYGADTVHVALWACPTNAPTRSSSGPASRRKGGWSIGSEVWLAGRDAPPFEVVGVVASPGETRPRTGRSSSLTPKPAMLYGHPGQADLIGVIGHPDPDALRRAAPGLTVLLGASRGDAEQPGGSQRRFDACRSGR